MQSTRLAGHAEKFLRMLAEDTDRPRSLERYYVKVAFSHGVTVQRIAELSTIPLERVQVLLAERDG